MVHTFSHCILYIFTYLIHNWCLYQSIWALKMWNNSKTLKIAHFGHFWPFFGHFWSGTDRTWVVHTFSHHILCISTYLYHNWCLYHSFQALKMWNNCKNSQNGQFWLFLAIFGHFCAGTDRTWVVHTFSHHILYISTYLYHNWCLYQSLAKLSK